MSSSSENSESYPVQESSVQRWLSPVRRFMHIEASSGLVLVSFTLLALMLANSRWATSFEELWHVVCQVSIGNFVLKKDLLHVINDGLMTIFFFVVGLEIKREMVVGELQSFRKAILPVIAALGGVILPASCFLLLGNLLHLPPETARAWAIPMATDIAFVVGVLALFGNRVPFGLKILMLSLAIVDDLIAVLVIAFVFTEQIGWGALLLAAAGFSLTYTMNKLNVRSIPAYVVLGFFIWLAVLKSGVHPTVAGVLLGLMTPVAALIEPAVLGSYITTLAKKFDGDERDTMREFLKGSFQRISFAIKESVSPLARLEQGLHPWVAFLIMPLFAFANAGVVVKFAEMSDPLAVAVALSLFLGKPVGIMIFCAVSVKLGIAQLPKAVTWRMLFAAACLAGIGFTMSIFLATLSLPTQEIAAGKIGILAGSLASAILGSTALYLSTKGRSASLVA